jgi:hypothetical protein
MTKGKLYGMIPELAILRIGNTNEGDLISYTNHTDNLKLLDEAKKEFIEKQIDGFDSDPSLFYWSINEWFNKWLGDPDE